MTFDSITKLNNDFRNFDAFDVKSEEAQKSNVEHIRFNR